jgi:pimeloyl-ACP methyl ester carboxylesterase
MYKKVRTGFVPSGSALEEYRFRLLKQFTLKRQWQGLEVCSFGHDIAALNKFWALQDGDAEKLHLMNLEKKYLKVSFGNIAYLEMGVSTKPAVLFVHGIPTSSFLWRHVLEFLQNDLHCFAPDLMGLGDTDVDPDGGEFHMAAQAEMLLEFMTALGHERFAVVCHDQGCAAVQIIAARQPERLPCLVMTDCVCYDNWPTETIAKLQKMAGIPFLMKILTKIGFFEWRETRTRFSSFRRALYDPERFSTEAIREYLRPGRNSAKRFECFKKFLLAGNPRYTMEAVSGLKEFYKPTLILWAADDPELSPSWGKKLFDEIPGAKQFELIPFCGHFWQEEKPLEFASLIRDFFAAHYAFKG